MKGIVLAGGSATRLYPATQVVSKQLLPVGDKPMIYYPLSVLLEAGICDVLLISTPRDLPLYEQLLGDGSGFGMCLSYLVQEKPEGLAQAFVLAERFLDGDSCCLVLGDNVFYGQGLADLAAEAAQLTEGGIIFGYQVSDPERYGVVEFAADGRVLSIEEKPAVPKSRYAIPGLYFFDSGVVESARGAARSERGEYEITEVHNEYLRRGKLSVKLLPPGIAWLDTGTYESLLDASNFIMTVQSRQGLMVGCLEEIALRRGLVDAATVRERGRTYGKTGYGKYLIEIAG